MRNVVVPPSPNWYGVHAGAWEVEHDLYAYAAQNSVVVLRPSSGSVLASIPAHSKRVTAVAFANAEGDAGALPRRHLVSAGADLALRSWSVPGWGCRCSSSKLPAEPSAVCPATDRNLSGSCRCTAAADCLVVVGCKQGSLRSWNHVSGGKTQPLASLGAAIAALRPLPAGGTCTGHVVLAATTTGELSGVKVDGQGGVLWRVRAHNADIQSLSVMCWPCPPAHGAAVDPGPVPGSPPAGQPAAVVEGEVWKSCDTDDQLPASHPLSVSDGASGSFRYTASEFLEVREQEQAAARGTAVRLAVQAAGAEQLLKTESSYLERNDGELMATQPIVEASQLQQTERFSDIIDSSLATPWPAALMPAQQGSTLVAPAAPELGDVDLGPHTVVLALTASRSMDIRVWSWPAADLRGRAGNAGADADAVEDPMLPGPPSMDLDGCEDVEAPGAASEPRFCQPPEELVSLQMPKPPTRIGGTGQASRLWVAACWCQLSGGGCGEESCREAAPLCIVASPFLGQLYWWQLPVPPRAPLQLQQLPAARRVEMPWGAFSHSRTVFVLETDTRHRARRVATAVSLSMDRTAALWSLQPVLDHTPGGPGGVQKRLQGLKCSASRAACHGLGGFVHALDHSALDGPAGQGVVAAGCGDNSIRFLMVTHAAGPPGPVLDATSASWGRAPDRVTALAWHPTVPGLLGFGCSGGQVGMLLRQQGLVGIFSQHHKGPVASLSWRGCPEAHSSAQPLTLCTCGAEGSVLEWPSFESAAELGAAAAAGASGRSRKAARTSLAAFQEPCILPGSPKLLRELLEQQPPASLQDQPATAKPYGAETRAGFAAAAWHRSGSWLAAATHGFGLGVYFWEGRAMRQVYDKSHPVALGVLEWSRDSGADGQTAQLAAAGEEGRVLLLAMPPGGEAEAEERLVLAPAEPSGSRPRIDALSWSPAGGRLAAGAADGRVFCWSVACSGNEAQPQLLAVLEAHTRPVLALTWLPQGKPADGAAADEEEEEDAVVLSGGEEQCVVATVPGTLPLQQLELWQRAACQPDGVNASESASAERGAGAGSSGGEQGAAASSGSAAAGRTPNRFSRKPGSLAFGSRPLLQDAVLAAGGADASAQAQRAVSNAADQLIAAAQLPRRLLEGAAAGPDREASNRAVLEALAGPRPTPTQQLAAQKAAMLRLWQGDLQGALQVLLAADALTADFVSASVVAGRPSWLAVLRAYAGKLELAGEPHLAALHLLSAHEVAAAVNVYRRAGLLTEAATLASLRLPAAHPLALELQEQRQAEQPEA